MADFKVCLNYSGRKWKLSAQMMEIGYLKQV